MGEYALYRQRRIKIGTCEDLLYLRWDQAHAVTPLPGGPDPVKHRDAYRFRFPFPDEDGTPPGMFADPFRALVLAGARVPAGVDHYSAECGGDSTALVQQRWLDGLLVAVCQCQGCEARYRLPQAADVAHVLFTLSAMAETAAADGDELDAVRLRTVADRVAAGYVHEDEETAGDHRDPHPHR